MAGSESIEQNKQQEGGKDDGKKPSEVKEEDLSEEDKQLKEELELCIERLKENDIHLYRPALETLRQKIRESTSSMTSVPKPLKFMRPFYNDMVAIYEKIHDVHNKVLSLLKKILYINKLLFFRLYVRILFQYLL
jgi:26S proteasome regulatory subunit N1